MYSVWYTIFFCSNLRKVKFLQGVQKHRGLKGLIGSFIIMLTPSDTALNDVFSTVTL